VTQENSIALRKNLALDFALSSTRELIAYNEKQTPTWEIRMTRQSTGSFTASSLTTLIGLFAAGLVAAASSNQVSAASAEAESARSPSAPVAKSRDHEQWRKAMSHTANERGCFRADYPEKVWKAVACSVAPLNPHPPRVRTGPAPDAVGNGVDYAAELAGQLISYGEGSFGTSAILTETDGASDSYSLQLNTNVFTTSACNGVPGCTGWQQYIFDNNAAGSGTAAVYIQYWLINHPSPCPAGYTFYPGGAGGSGCYKNSTGVAVPVQALLNLSGLALTGTAVGGGLDQITLFTGTSIYSTYGEDTVLNASLGWLSAEFNVFGYSSAGPVATFASGTLLSIETMVSNGVTTVAPTVLNTGYTFESNNLSFAPLGACSVADPNGPYIWFQESFGATPASTCPVTPISLPAPTVTVTGPTMRAIESFSFSWPSVSGATYYVMTRNGAESTTTGNSASVGIACQQTALVQFSSCDAAGCGWPQTVLNAKNTSPCN
jgi:hypothetical protein